MGMRRAPLLAAVETFWLSAGRTTGEASGAPGRNASRPLPPAAYFSSSSSPSSSAATPPTAPQLRVCGALGQQRAPGLSVAPNVCMHAHAHACACALRQSSRTFASTVNGVDSNMSNGTGQANNDDSAPATAEPSGRQALAQLERRMAMFFTCTKCETRSVKSFSRRSYEKGLVLVRCPGCQAHHLVADHLGRLVEGGEHRHHNIVALCRWFGDKGFTVEDLQKEQGTRVTVVDANAHPGIGGLSAEDMAGWSRLEALRKQLVAVDGRVQEQLDADGSASCGATPPLEMTDDVVEITDGEAEVWRRVSGARRARGPGT